MRRDTISYPSAHLERSTYVLVSSLLPALIFWQWRPLPTIVWEFDNGAARTAIGVLFWSGVALTIHSSFLIDHAHFTGLRQVFAHAAGRPYSPPGFRVTSWYGFVRHPLFLGTLVAFWAAPTMTVGHLVFAAVNTLYIIIGIRFEERDLGAALGVDYAAYRRAVPMLFPVKPWRQT